MPSAGMALSVRDSRSTGPTAAWPDAAARDDSWTEVRELVRLFQCLLPGLVTNVACFRAPLG